MRGRRLHDIKHDYFDDIDTSVKSYILGFFVADGTIEINQTGRYCIRFVQKQSDSAILYLIQKEISPSSKIEVISRVSSTYNRLSITSTDLGNALIKNGLMPRKTYNDFHLPMVPQLFQRDLIRGFFDGDGTSGAYIGYKSVVRSIAITSYSSTILYDILEILNLNSISAKVIIVRGYFRLEIRSYKEWYNYIYPGVTTFKRKQEGCALCTLTSSEIRSLKALDPCNA